MSDQLRLRVKELEREIADLKLQLLAKIERDKKRVRVETRVIKRMQKEKDVIHVYPEDSDMLTFILERGNLPAFSKLTERQQRGVRAAIGIGCATNGVYDGVRNAINHEIVSHAKTYQV